MKVEVRMQKSIPQYRTSGEDTMGTQYQVILSDQGEDVVVASFSTPGSFLDGFLSETQAKGRARDRAENLRAFFEDVQPAKVVPSRSQSRTRSGQFEDRSFAPARGA